MGGLADCHNIQDLRDAAKAFLPKAVFEFIDRATEDEVAPGNNRAAFERIKLLHRSLVPVSARTTATSLFGKPAAMPLAIAPTGAAGLCRYEGELDLARAAAKAGVPFSLATGAMVSIERIAQEAGGRLWFQLYVRKIREQSFELIERAKACGYEALVITTDTAAIPNREYNARNGFFIPFRLNARFTLDALAHPAWFATVLLKYLTTTGVPHSANTPRPQPGAGAQSVAPEDNLSWDDISAIRDRWPGVLILKGFQRVDDAERAVSCGVDGIIVSNHGGRNLDSSAAPIDLLPGIAGAVGGKITVMLDSGVRRGSDVAKALALGAKGVLIGRPPLYGAAVDGEAGAAKAIEILKTELARTMAYVGCNTVDELTSDIVFGGRR